MVILNWNEQCNNLPDDNNRLMMVEIDHQLEIIKPQKLLIDLNYWYKNTLFNIFSKCKPQFLAIVVPSNLFNQIMFEATDTVAKLKNSQVQYFIDRKKAENWLKCC